MSKRKKTSNTYNYADAIPMPYVKLVNTINQMLYSTYNPYNMPFYKHLFYII